MSWIIYRLYTNTVDQLDGAEDLRRPDFARFLYSFFRETSLQGVPQIIKQPGLAKKLLWVLVVVACIVGLAWEMDMFVGKFLQFKTLTSSSSKIEQQLYFPAVTVCSSNAVTKDWLQSRNGTGKTVEELELQSLLPPGDRLQVGHYLCDIVMSCNFGSKSRNAINEDFSTYHWNPYYGNCFTFNAGYKKQASPLRSIANDAWALKVGAIRQSRLPGHRNGLHLILNSDFERYSEATEQVGWRVVIHNQTNMPFPEESGIAIMPGTSTEIALTQRRSKKLGLVDNIFYNVAYSDCIEATALNPNDPNNAFSSVLEVAYTHSACQKTCNQRHLMQQCNCYDWSKPHTGAAFASIENGEHLHVCLPFSASCMERTLDDILTGKLPCHCPETCTSYTYDATVSTTKWPSSNKIALGHICNRLLALQRSRANNSDFTCFSGSRLSDDLLAATSRTPPQLSELEQCSSDDVINRKYAEVYIYYKDFNVESLVEEQQFELMDFVAYLGAIVSLFFGITVITACEYIQLSIDLFIILVWNIACALKSIFIKYSDRIRYKSNSNHTVSRPVVSGPISGPIPITTTAASNGNSIATASGARNSLNFHDVQMLANVGTRNGSGTSGYSSGYGGVVDAARIDEMMQEAEQYMARSAAPRRYQFQLDDDAWR